MNFLSAVWFGVDNEIDSHYDSQQSYSTKGEQDEYRDFTACDIDFNIGFDQLQYAGPGGRGAVNDPGDS